MEQGAVRREGAGTPQRGVVADPGGMPVAEIAAPAAQVSVDVLNDLFDRVAEPLAEREFTDPVACSLHRLA
jgi:hypothetical protein